MRTTRSRPLLSLSRRGRLVRVCLLALKALLIVLIGSLLFQSSSSRRY